MTCVVIEGFVVPEGLTPRATTLLLRLPAGFPDSPPDMFWCDPPLRLSNGSYPRAAENMEPYLNRIWQRFSRHLASGSWRPGQDNLRTWLAIVRRALQDAAAGN